MKRIRKAALVAAVSTIPLTQAFGQLVAMPGAEGYGAYATGGRGGSVYVVTNLNDSGSGSFRTAVSQPNRIVVFAVGGNISLNSAVPVMGNITILGQTAPGGGIGLNGGELSLSGSSNDIVQYLRIRQGTNSTDSGESSVNAGTASNIMLDHLSVEFGQFDNIDAVGAVNMTLQNSIDADPIGQQFNAHVETGAVTFANNIFSSAHNRSPLVKANGQFVNNIVYNYQAGYTVASTGGVFSQDIVNNYFIAGPGTTNSGNDAFFQMDSTITAYSKGNLIDTNKNGTLNGSSISPSGVTVSTTPTQASTNSLPTLSGNAAYNWNIVHSGDSILHDPTSYAVSNGYDQVDSNVMGDVTSLGTAGAGTGLWTTQTSTGLGNNGYGVIGNGTIPTSTAKDGIPDSWAITHGLSKTNSAGAILQNALGYDMIEQYAQELADTLAVQTWSATSGEWSTNTANWSAAAPGAYDHALISGTGSADGVATLTKTGALAYSLQIGNNGPAAGEKLLVSGGSLTVYNTITVGYQNQGTLQMTGGTVVADNVQLGNTVFNGNGTPTTYTGTLILSGGTLQTTEVVQGGGTPGNWTTGSAWTWSGGTLQAGTAGLVVSAPATLGAANGILDTNGVSAQINRVLSGAGGFTKIGAGTATISGSNTYLGPTTITAGTLEALNLANGGTASALGASSNAAANLILNGGTLMGSGNTDRLFTLTDDSTLDNSDGMSFTNSGAIAVAVGANVALTFTGSNTGHNTFSPALGDEGNGFVTSVVVNGTGLWDFSNGAKTYSGDTDVTSGELQTLSANALSPQSNMVISAGATLDFHSNSQTMNGLSGAGNITDSFGNGETFTIGQTNGSGNFSGTITGNLSITKAGSGIQVLSGANAYTNGTTISGGTLSISADNNLGPSTSAVNLNGGTLSTTAGITDTHVVTVGASGGTINVATTGQYYFPTANTLAGNGTLTVTGTGNLTANTGNLRVAASNSFTGNVILQNGGILEYGAAGAIGSAGTITINNQGELAVQGYLSENVAVPNAIIVAGGNNSELSFENGSSGAVSGNITLNANATIGLRDWYDYTTSRNGTISGVISGSGFGITTDPGSSTGGVLTLTNSNSYTGSTTIVAGTSIQLGGGGTTGSISASSAITDNGTLIINRSNTASIANAISGAGGLTQSGGGTTILSGTSTFAGGTIISAGTLSISANANLGSATVGQAPVTINGGTLSTTNTTLLTDTHAITIGSAGGTINVMGIGSAGTSQLYLPTANLLQGSGNLTVTGNGTVNPSGAGNLRVAASNSFSGNVTLQSGGIFEYGAASAIGSAGTITVNNQSELAVQGYLSGNVSLPNSIVVAGGNNSVLSFENGNSGMFSGNITLNANATIGLRDWYNYATSRNGTISGVISGNGSITTNSGTSTGGVLTLTNSNRYSGGTTISAGTLLANSTDTTNGSTGSGLVNVGSAGILGGTGQIRGSVTVHGIITAGSAPSGTAPGVLTANASGQTTTLAGGGTYDVKIDSKSAGGVAGTNWDELVLSAVAITASNGNAFSVTLNSLNSGNTAGAISGISPSLWTVATTTAAPTGITLSGNGSTILAVSGTGTGAPAVTSGDAGIFVLNTAGFDTANGISSSGSYFALELINTGGTNYAIDVYTSAPEPGVASLLIAGGLPSLLKRRRRS